MYLKQFGLALIFLFSILPNHIWAQEQTPLRDFFKKGYIRVLGKSEGKQSRFQAIRAAEVMAQRELLKILQSVKIYGSKEIGEGVQPEDIEGFLKGAVPCGATYHEEKGYAEVCLRLNLYGPQGLYDSILPWLRENRIGPEFKMVYQSEIPSVPANANRAYDGVIIDVRALPFQPALLNRILTYQDTLVFDPLQIKPELLIEHGCSGYASDMQEAQNILRQWDSCNPFVLTALELNQYTDVKISPEQAGFLLAGEQAHAVLSQAKIVFLVRE